MPLYDFIFNEDIMFLIIMGAFIAAICGYFSIVFKCYGFYLFCLGNIVIYNWLVPHHKQNVKALCSIIYGEFLFLEFLDTVEYPSISKLIAGLFIGLGTIVIGKDIMYQ